MQIPLKGGVCVNLRSWNARRFPGQILLLKKNMVWKTVGGLRKVVHMSVKSTS